MSFWDIVDIFANLSLLGDPKSKKDQPKIYGLFYILMVPAVFWFALELKSIMASSSPFLLFVVAFAVGVALTFGTIMLIYRLDLIDRIRTKDFFAIFVPIVLFTISIASLLSRQ